MNPCLSPNGDAGVLVQLLKELSETLTAVGAPDDAELAQLRELQCALGLCFGRAEWIRRRAIQRSFDFVASEKGGGLR